LVGDAAGIAVVMLFFKDNKIGRVRFFIETLQGELGAAPPHMYWEVLDGWDEDTRRCPATVVAEAVFSVTLKFMIKEEKGNGLDLVCFEFCKLEEELKYESEDHRKSQREACNFTGVTMAFKGTTFLVALLLHVFWLLLTRRT
jgi:hypothetical protein